MTISAQAAPSAAPHAPSTAPEPPRDALVAKVLAAGAFFTAAIGAPGQFVLPDALKSATAALFATVALALLLWRRDEKTPLRWSLFIAAPLALAALAAVSAFWAPASPALMEAARWLLIGIVVLVALNVLGPDTFPWTARAIHWGTVVTAVLALAEFWFALGIFPAPAAPGSTFGNRNLFAEYVAVALPFSVWLLFSASDLRSVLLRAAGLGLIVLSVMATGTRAGMVAVLVVLGLAGALLIVLRLRGGLAGWSRGAIAAAVAVPVVVFFALAWVPTRNAGIIEEHRASKLGLNVFDRATARLQTLSNPNYYTGVTSFGRRVSVWSAGRGMLAAHPLAGVGGGAWNTVAPLYLPDDLDTEYIWMAHNEPLQLVAELGLLAWIALAAALALLIQSIAAVLRDLRERRAEAAWMRSAAIFSVLSFGLVAGTGLPLHQAPPTLLLALALGCLLAFQGPRLVSADRLNGLASQAARWTAAVLVLVTLVLSVQGLRSSNLVQRSTSILLGIKPSNLPPADAKRYHTEATEMMRRGIGIYADHGVHLMRATQAFAELGDAAGVLWLSNLMLETRPYVAEVQCNLARAHTDLSQFAEAGALIDKMVKDKPRSPCLPLTRFVYDYKRGNFAGALAVGQSMIQQIDSLAVPEQRYIVDMSYRAATRVPDADAAIAILRVRAARFPEFRAGSLYLIGQTLAQRAPTALVPEALEAYRQALAQANNAEQAALLGRIPEPYKSKLQ